MEGWEGLVCVCVGWREVCSSNGRCLLRLAERLFLDGQGKGRWWVRGENGGGGEGKEGGEGGVGGREGWEGRSVGRRLEGADGRDGCIV